MEAEDLFKRDISWLSFNFRVLQEAMDPAVPLYERIKFLAIYSSNLDEFFRVRVASLRSFKELKKETRRAMEVKPKKELREIRRIVRKQQERFGHTFREEILPALAEQGVHLLQESDFSAEQEAFAGHYFKKQIKPLLESFLISADTTEVPFLKNKALYFALSFRDSDRLAIINIPSDQLPRFHRLPTSDGSHQITFLDDIIRHCLEDYFGQPVKGAYAIKVSRDAELYIDDEYQGDLLEKIKKSLATRNVGLPTRFLYDNTMPEEMLAQLKKLLGLTKNDLIPGARYHNFNDFFTFPDPTGKPGLHFPPMPPLPHPQLEGAASITALIAGQDQILHFPYQRYDYLPQWIREAATDPEVVSIKITLYRVASRSAVIEALLFARQQAKAVTAFIEAKARFDESSNIHFGEQLENAGASVFYSYPGIKVHAKMLLISRREKEKLRHYAFLSTGNFNEKTARVYADHALLTADPRLTEEIAMIFSMLERRILMPSCQYLLVAPFSLRQRFEALIEREIAHARSGRDSYIILKLNNLEDPGMIGKLYEASQAGVRIQIIVRGICCLIPGREGLSENIEAISIVDRFLEHARAYLFANGGREELFLASADWMTRNLDHRVEIAWPILDPKVFAELRKFIELQWNDNIKARIIDADQSNRYRPARGSKPEVSAQYDMYHFLRTLSVK